MSAEKEQNTIIRLQRDRDRMLKRLLTQMDKSEVLMNGLNDLNARVSRLEDLIQDAQEKAIKRHRAGKPDTTETNSVAQA